MKNKVHMLIATAIITVITALATATALACFGSDC